MLCEPETRTVKTDVLVLGGGLPGVCAAIAAAGSGADVTLLERGRTLGGNCGPELGVHPSDAHRFHDYMVSVGTVGRIIEDAAWESAKTATNWKHYNISQRWDTVMTAALKKAGVHLLRMHYAHTPDVENKKIVAVICEDTATYRRIRIEVSGSVIDASGDGNVSALAGAGFRMGREARSEFNERFAPETADSVTMGSSLVALVKKTGDEIEFTPPEGTPPFYPGYGGMVGFRPGEDESLSFFFPCETGGDLDVIEDEHIIYDRLTSMMYSAWNRVKNGEDAPYSKNWELLWMSPKVGKRESRRFLGDHVLDLNDLEAGTVFEDAIAAGGFAVDIHYPKPEKPEYVRVEYHLIPPLYTIPYRSIYSRDVDNLFFASRLLSVTHQAHGSVRLQRTLATIGQAAGTAAAMCFEKGLSPRELYTRGFVPELQQRLTRDDAGIPGVVKNDPEDLVPRSRLSASSETLWTTGDAEFFVPLDVTRGAELWDFTSRVDGVSFLVKNTLTSPVTLSARLLRYSPERQFQYHNERRPIEYYSHHNEVDWGNDNSPEHFTLIATADACLSPGFEGFAEFAFNADLGTSKNPFTDDDRLLVLLAPAPGAELGMNDSFYEYVRSVEGEEDGCYLVRPRTCVCRLSPAPPYGAAEQLKNGQIRRFSSNPINMWRPQKLPATLKLDWDSAFSAGELHITLDTLERTAHEMPFECGKKVSPRVVSDLTVEFCLGDEVKKTVSLTNNRHRLVRLHGEGVLCDGIRITLCSTQQPGAVAGVYDLRVYPQKQNSF